MNYKDFSLGLKPEDFDQEETKFLYWYVSQKGNILSGGVKRFPVTFLEKLVNHMMKQGRNTGKKTMCYNQLERIIKNLALIENKPGILVLVKGIFNLMPRVAVRREKRGSGVITRAIYFSPHRRVVEGLCNLTNFLSKKRKRKENYEKCFLREILLCYRKDSSSELLKKKKELQTLAKNSNY